MSDTIAVLELLTSPDKEDRELGKRFHAEGFKAVSKILYYEEKIKICLNKIHANQTLLTSYPRQHIIGIPFEDSIKVIEYKKDETDEA